MSETQKALSNIEAKMVYIVVANSIKQYCERIEAAGSLRRRRPEVNDIDIVLIPHKGCMDKIKEICLAFHPLIGPHKPPKWGERMASFRYKEVVGVDLYFADEVTWPILWLIRTGSKEHNIHLCNQAKMQGMYLAADGSGLFKDRLKTEIIPVASERDVFENLRMPYLEPEDREIKK